MPTYAFEAMDASGSLVKDRLDADNETHARFQLRRRGLSVTSLRLADGEAVPTGEPAFPVPKPIPRLFLFIWSSGFLIAGSVFLVILTILPLWGMIRASSWVETPCTVLSSRLAANRSSNSGRSQTTYNIEVTYRYEYLGQTYQSDRYDFGVMPTNTNVKSRQSTVKQLRPGTQTVCFVNPNDPTEAVLNRDLTSEAWWGLFPIPFVTIGAVGMLFCLGVFGSSARASSRDQTRP